MKSVKITLGGREYYLLFNGEAMFRLQDLYGEKPIFEVLAPNDRTAFGELCKVLAILAEQGELARRQLGYDKGPMLTEEQVRALITPIEVLSLKMEVFKAVARGYGREIEDTSGAVDLVLAELEKKEEPA